MLILISAAAIAEKPRIYTAQPIENATAYNKRASDAYAAGVWTIEELENASSTSQSSEDATRAYERARLAFKEAVDAEPSMYEAHSYLGYANRKLGRYQDALRCYEAALKLKPDYVYAIEYQGEAYLALNDFTRARFNYLRLYALDASLAAKLLDAMRQWLDTYPNTTEAQFTAARDWIETQSRHTH